MNKKEFEKLQPGQVIQHKNDPKWVFIVHQNFGDRLSAIRSIEVRDPENWETVTEVKILDKKLRCYEEVFEGDPLSVHHECGYPRGSHKVDANNNLVCPEDDQHLNNAAESLHEILKNEPWYQVVGMGINKLVIYTTKKKHPKHHIKFGTYPVEYKYVGKIKPTQHNDNQPS